MNDHRYDYSLDDLASDLVKTIAEMYEDGFERKKKMVLLFFQLARKKMYPQKVRRFRPSKTTKAFGTFLKRGTSRV
jgi:hypothetical protein